MYFNQSLNDIAQCKRYGVGVLYILCNCIYTGNSSVPLYANFNSVYNPIQRRFFERSKNLLNVKNPGNMISIR